MTLVWNAHSRWVRAVLGGWLGLVLVAQVLAAQQVTHGNGRDIHGSVETERATYRAGDTVRVRISLNNLSDVPISFSPYPPWDQVKLLITRDGQRIAPTLTFGGGGSASPAYTLKPRQSWTLGWLDETWWSLADYGYDVRAPGTYGIQVIPQIFGPWVIPDLSTVRSNTATFTVTP